MPISRITGASIEDGSIVIADLGITTFNTGTGNTLTLQANSATGLVISVTGNTAISNTLSFTGTGARVTGDFSNATIANRILFQTSTANNNTSVQTIPNGTAVVSQFSAFNNSDPTNASLIGIRSSDTEGRLEAARSGTGTFLPLTMYTNGSERLRIDTNGNVGIGTSNPTNAKLHVVGDWVGGSSTIKSQTITSFASGGQAGYGTYDSNGTRIALLYSYTSGTVLGTSTASPLSFETNGVERARIDSAGRIGIGTASPSQLLHVAAGTILASNTSSTSATVAIAGNGSTVGTSAFELIQGGSSEAYVYNRANSFLVLGTNNTEQMRITAAGNVGIGTSSTDPFSRSLTRSVAISSSGAGTSSGLFITSGAGSRVQLGIGSTSTLLIYSDSTNFSAISTETAMPLLLQTNQTERMRITSGGNVGIGVTDPVSPLTVKTFGGNSAFTVPSQTAIGGSTGGRLNLIGSEPGLMLNTDMNFATGAQTGTGTASLGLQIGLFGANDPRCVLFWAGSPAPLVFANASTPTGTITERMRIDSGGAVGIGTSSPGARLDVFNATATEVRSMSSTTSSYANFIVDVNNVVNQRLQMVGFGSTASDNLLGIARANNGFLVKSGGLLGVGTRDSNALVFGTNEAERMRIASNGYVGIGSSTNVDHPLLVISSTSDYAISAESTHPSNPGGYEIRYTASATNNNGAFFFLASDTSATRCIIKSNGGINNFQGNDSNLSDVREKKNINLAGSYLDKICAIPVKTFNYIDQNQEEDDGLTLGVIAQDVQAVAPELVSESDWGTEDNPKMRLSVYQTDLQFALMKCIQEQQAIIESLTARIETLEKN
jgi:hypothetical protein